MTEQQSTSPQPEPRPAAPAPPSWAAPTPAATPPAAVPVPPGGVSPATTAQFPAYPGPGAAPTTGAVYPAGTYGTPTSYHPAPGHPAPGQPAFGHPGGGQAPPPGQPGGFGHAGTPGRPARSGGGRRAAVVVLAGFAALVIALCSGLVGGVVGQRLDDDPATTTTVRQAAPPLDRSSLASIAANVLPSVVSISTGTGAGSGVVLAADGSILTNNHVVEGARQLTVTFSNGRTAPAKTVGTDSTGDLAVIRAEGATDLKPAKFGDSDALQVGDSVIAVGSPLGLQGSVTAGIVSALHRTINEGEGRKISLGDAIQTDAAINPGNSGGALVNTAGEVVGINTAIATSGQGGGNIGVGFAIPANRAKRVAGQLGNGGKVTYPYLGVQVADAPTGGALLGDVIADGPAAKGGLVKGDVVKKAGDKAVNNGAELVAAVQSRRPGETLKLVVVREGAEREVSVTLGEVS
jgi:putative serine protease PepD